MSEALISRQSIFFCTEKVPRSMHDVMAQPFYCAEGIIYAQNTEKSSLQKKIFPV